MEGAFEGVAEASDAAGVGVGWKGGKDNYYFRDWWIDSVDPTKPFDAYYLYQLIGEDRFCNRCGKLVASLGSCAGCGPPYMVPSHGVTLTLKILLYGILSQSRWNY